MSKNVKILILICVLLYVAELLAIHHKGHGFNLHTLKGSHLLVGLIGSVVLMFFAKSLGKFFLYRKTDYYKESN